MSEHEAMSASPGEIETGIAGRACEACHRKKTKCDMQQPVCGLCRRTNKACHFPSTRKRPSRQEPSVRAKLQKVNGNLDRLVELLEANPHLEHDSLKGILDAKRDSQGPSTSTGASKTRSNSTDGVTVYSPSDDAHVSPGALSAAPQQPVPRVSHGLATHLIDVFFDKVQPWLPLLHKPIFMDWSKRALVEGDDALSSTSCAEALLLFSVFALSARFSSHLSLITTPPSDRGEVFKRAADHYWRIIRDREEADLVFFKSCILLASYCYATGQVKRGWYITHMCIRGCYELGLHQIDDTEDSEESNEVWVEKESMRRAFWCIFEIDSFGSIVKRKPFAIDWRHIQVKMPVDDEAWFSGQKVESSKFIPGADCWKTLVGSPNQNERAWTLLSKATVGHVFDLSLFKDGISSEQQSTAESSMSCFRLAMPESLQLTSSVLSTANASPARKNWVISTHLYLAAATFILRRVPIHGRPPSPDDEAHSNQLAAYSSRVHELNEILRRWPPDAIQYAHPCLACTMLTYDESVVNLLPPSGPVNAYKDLSNLILARIAERWKLGAVLLRVREVTTNYHQSDEEARADLVRQYPIYFEREFRRTGRARLEGAQRPRSAAATTATTMTTTTPTTMKSGGSSQAHIIPGSRSSVEQLASPDQNLFLQQQQHSLSLQQQQQQQQQQQATPPFNFGPPSGADSGGGDEDDTMITIANDAPTTMYNDAVSGGTTNKMGFQQGFYPSYNPGQMPEDIDALFAGFLQEPWWQDYGPVNFVV